MNKITAALKLQSFKYLAIRLKGQQNKNPLNGQKIFKKKSKL